MTKYPKELRPPPTPKKSKSWNVPPPPATGDKDEDNLYAAIGRALTAWGHLEEEFASIFACLVVAGEPEPAARAYGSVLSFRGRKDMIAAAAEAFFFLYPNNENRLQPALADLLKEAVEFAARRAEIAHGIVQENKQPPPTRLRAVLGGYRYADPKIDPKRPVGFVLVPADHATSKTEMEKGRTIIFNVRYVPRYVYSSVEIAAFTEHFQRLKDWAARFPLVILGHRQRVTESTST